MVSKLIDNGNNRVFQVPILFVNLYQIATNFTKILEAHLKNNETWAYDDIYLANKNNFKIMQILGSDFNIKITKPEDLEIAERYLK